MEPGQCLSDRQASGAGGVPTAPAIPAGFWRSTGSVADIGAPDNSASELVGAQALRGRPRGLGAGYANVADAWFAARLGSPCEAKDMTAIGELYAAHPELYAVEHGYDHRVEGRRGILALAKPGTIGAELGVFTGLFPKAVLESVRPAVLHLVDPWWFAYGELYPNWGAYTAGGTLPTRVAHEAAVARAQAARGDCEVQVHVSTSADWLRSLPDASLDWVYLDSTHYYRETLEELKLLRHKLRPEGLVLGDDWFPSPAAEHHGVFRAVHQLVRKGMWDIVRADEQIQWAIRPAVKYRRGERYRRAVRARLARILGR